MFFFLLLFCNSDAALERQMQIQMKMKLPYYLSPDRDCVVAQMNIRANLTGSHDILIREGKKNGEKLGLLPNQGGP